MRIYIIGLPGSGKTTLATEIAVTHRLNHIELDQLFHFQNEGKFGRRFVEDFQDILLAQLDSESDWIVEGAYPITEIAHRADRLLYLDRNPLTCIYWQWRRFFSDPAQRNKAQYGLATNLGLTFLTIGLALNIRGVKVYKNKSRSSLRDFVNEHSAKVVHFQKNKPSDPLKPSSDP